MDNRPVAVITGATNGLGRLAALDLAHRGFHLGIVARSRAKVDDLRQEIAQSAPGTSVDAFIADLTSLRDVRGAGKEIEARYQRIAVLVNNAGLHAFSQRVTADGFAEMTAVNYLAPWVLTTTLRDKLVASTPARKSRRNCGTPRPPSSRELCPPTDQVGRGAHPLCALHIRCSRCAAPRQGVRPRS